MRVANKVALVTGGGSGIGRATAELLAREGATVYVSDIEQANAVAVAEGITAAGGSARGHALDISSEPAWQDLLAAVQAQHGGLDILVNNAARFFMAPLEQSDASSLRQLLQVNVEGLYAGIRLAVPVMNSHAAVVNVSSGVAIQGAPHLSAYAASKGAVRAMSRSLAQELGQLPKRIRVNSVFPGMTQTPFVEQAYGKAVADQVFASAIADSVLGRAGHPEEVAAGILFLASDESSFVTGAELVIDGGLAA